MDRMTLGLSSAERRNLCAGICNGEEFTGFGRVIKIPGLDKSELS